jgi:hypothetical protein
LVKGDCVEVVVDVGNGVQRFEITATRAGRRVDISNVRGTVEVTEVTRSGVAVRTARFMASRVVALVEHPAGEASTAAAKPPGSRGPRQPQLNDEERAWEASARPPA